MLLFVCRLSQQIKHAKLDSPFVASYNTSKYVKKIKLKIEHVE